METIAPFEVKIYIVFKSKKGPKSIFADNGKIGSLRRLR
jgi:hypothetical protein